MERQAKYNIPVSDYIKKEDQLFFTVNNIEITDLIKQGLTIMCKTQEEATKLAQSKRSYTYQIFNLDDELVGFGVPK